MDNESWIGIMKPVDYSKLMSTSLIKIRHTIPSPFTFLTELLDDHDKDLTFHIKNNRKIV